MLHHVDISKERSVSIFRVKNVKVKLILEQATKAQKGGG